MQELTQRQSEILRLVVEEYVTTGQPVASKALVERSGLDVSPSTVRGELAELERKGLLTHPHTSAGRVPTEHGYRFFADRLLERLEPRPPSFPLQLGEARSEQLERNPPLEPQILGQVDDAHAAPAQQRLDPIASEFGADPRVVVHLHVRILAFGSCRTIGDSGRVVTNSRFSAVSGQTIQMSSSSPPAKDANGCCAPETDLKSADSIIGLH